MGYGIYLATVAGSATVSDLNNEEVKADSRILVRIIPQMSDVPIADLPLYPPFFKDRAYTGKVGELVWVICANDFTLGYVLGPAGYNTYSTEEIFDKSGRINLSVPSAVKTAINDARVQKLGEGIDFTNLQIDFWSDDCMHFTCRNDGTKIIAYSNGTLYEFGKRGLLFIIGKSTFRIESSGMSFNGPSVGLSSPDVALGEHASGKVLVSAGTSSETSKASSDVRA